MFGFYKAIQSSQLVKWSFLSIFIGLMAGVAATIFLTLLKLVTDYRSEHPSFVWLLPFAGLAISALYHFFGQRTEAGSELILSEMHEPKNIIPFRMAPFVLVSTLITHAFGGSAGREGTSVQMGASLADQLAAIFSLSSSERKVLLIAGASAGFSAAIGTPLAGALFGLEFIQIGCIRLRWIFQCTLASFTAFYTSVFLAAPHTYYPAVEIPSYSVSAILTVIAAGVAFGITARIFIWSVRTVEHLQSRFFHKHFRPVIAGLLIAVLFWLEGSYRFAGLGLPAIISSFAEAAPWLDTFLKVFFTALTIGSGFKGGEFIPLVFIGTTLGSFLSTLFPMPTSSLAGLGLASVFAAVASAPISCAIMAAEIFGWGFFPFALLAAWTAYHSSGPAGLYKNQVIARKKSEQLRSLYSWMFKKTS